MRSASARRTRATPSSATTSEKKPLPRYDTLLARVFGLSLAMTHINVTLATAPSSCEVKTLANYKRPSAAHATGSIIAANANFTCYALIKDGLVRAIHRESAAMGLCRGLPHAVADLRFCAGQDMIAAISKSGAVAAWRLAAADGALRSAAKKQPQYAR